jgi:hypothetical protein
MDGVPFIEGLDGEVVCSVGDRTEGVPRLDDVAHSECRGDALLRAWVVVWIEELSPGVAPETVLIDPAAAPLLIDPAPTPAAFLTDPATDLPFTLSTGFDTGKSFSKLSFKPSKIFPSKSFNSPMSRSFSAKAALSFSSWPLFSFPNFSNSPIHPSTCFLFPAASASSLFLSASNYSCVFILLSLSFHFDSGFRVGDSSRLFCRKLSFDLLVSAVGVLDFRGIAVMEGIGCFEVCYDKWIGIVNLQELLNIDRHDARWI